ncbi:plasminogen-like, partial [Ruditapes philippinarum]|uniref:plasminogen-like n=1 Tax=Ruditapes philippinarum TaxID=129788 RepID=UPI00295AE6F6
MRNPPNSDCEWTILDTEGTDIVLIFLHFDIKCPDFISMTDISNNTMMPILDKVCILNEEIYFLGNKIHIHFVSDGSGQRKGFKIIWKVKSILTWHSEFVSVHEAHGICRRQGGSLVKDIAEYQDKIVDMMQERHVTSIWQAKNQYITPWVWLKGCFSFANLDDFETYVIVKNNSMAECQRLCSKWNYFGLQSDKCFCIESYAGSPVIMDHYCTISCSGNYEERCGGNLSLTIYMNDICYTNSSAWQGTVSRTKEGNTCLPWNNITAIIHDNTTVFPDGSAQNASNFCRNPNGSEALWCYVNQNETEFCDVPPCFHKETSNENCMAVYKSNSNELVFKRRPCTEGERAICYDV